MAFLPAWRFSPTPSGSSPRTGRASPGHCWARCDARLPRAALPAGLDAVLDAVLDEAER